MLKITGIIDFSGQAHCMEHASTVGSYQSHTYEGSTHSCWCGQSLDMEVLTPWDAASEEARAEADAIESGLADIIEPYCPAGAAGMYCSHVLAMNEDGVGVGCMEYIERQAPEGMRPVYDDTRWVWEAVTSPAAPVVAPEPVKPTPRKIERTAGALTKGAIVRTPEGLGVLVDVSSTYGEGLVKFYDTPKGGSELDVSHGAWTGLDTLTVLGFDADAMIFYAGRLRRAGEIYVTA